MTYLGLGVLVVTACLAVAVLTGARRREPSFAASIAITAVVLVALTVVFDSLMVAADLFRYDASALVAVRIWRAPVEDLAWPLATALLLPSLWVLLGPSRHAADGQRKADRVG